LCACIEAAGLPFILGMMVPHVPYVVAQWRREYLASRSRTLNRRLNPLSSGPNLLNRHGSTARTWPDPSPAVRLPLLPACPEVTVREATNQMAEPLCVVPAG